MRYNMVSFLQRRGRIFDFVTLTRLEKGFRRFVSPMQIGLTSRQVIEHRVRSSSVKESNFMLAGLQMWCLTI